jgi:hypothetical protein
MRRSFAAATAAVLLLPATGASAGGMSTFGFEDEYVAVGETVTGRTTFFTEVRRTGRIENGPWHAYLIPEGGWIEPPDIPATAIPVGPIAIEDRGHGSAVASITFTVPDVTVGSYHLGLCNVPCTESMVGDLGGGWLSIARTEEGASLLREVHRTERRLYRFRSGLARRVRAVERPFESLADRVDAMEDSLQLRLTRLEDRLGATLAAEQETDATPWATMLFAGAAFAVAAALLLRGGRRPRREPIRQEPPVVEWELPGEVSART